MATSTCFASRVAGVDASARPMRNEPGGHQQKTMPRLLIHSSPGLGFPGGSLVVAILRLREELTEAEASLGNENRVQISCLPSDCFATSAWTSAMSSPSGRSLAVK